MKSFAVPFTALALLIQLFGYASAQQPQGGQQPPPPTAGRAVEAPTFSVGDFWKYRRPHKGSEFSRTVTAIKSDLVTMVTGSGQELVFTKEGNEVLGHDLGGLPQRFDPFVPRLQFPLQEGKSWTRSYTGRDERAPRPKNGTLWAKVSGWERISLPAGTFDSLRIEIRISSERVKGPATAHDEVCWYAPEVKRFVKCSFSEHLKASDFELVRYQVK